ncbi:Glutamyl-tRNA(Gln) amidotransferase subunit A [Paraconexibacter sp. AEG42_29]|uniref:Glutamyl-tRNA(Gln) amidotransferase subunit A n=1 Tax=Paraconexibacter sp. AEG42_29 TaxID=2997339 RepID=A0AAU7AWZ0_9ACTN
MPVSRRRFLASAAATAAGVHTASAAAAVKKPASTSKRLGLPDPSTIKVGDPADLSLLECASLLQNRKLSSVELTRACLARSRARDGETTAWIRVYPEYAERLAKAADERLAPGSEKARRRKSPLVCGIPLALKDLYAAKGLPVTASSQVLAGNVATGDSTVWAKLRHSGMVLLGHAHTDEFAFGVGTPQSGNPWNPACSPGGSSGGSGAVLGARMVPAATGTDTGGSLRLPASACGITSLKPTFGRVSAYGVIPLVWTRDHCGPMARSAADVALLLSYMAGADQDDPSTLAGPAVPSGGYPHTPTRGARPFAGKTFGVARESVDELPAATAKLFARFLDEVRALGAKVKTVDMPVIPTGTIGGVSSLAETGVYHQQFAPASTGRYRAELQAVVAASIGAQALPVSDYLTANRDRTRYMHEYNALFAREGLTCIVYPGSNVDGPTRKTVAGLTIFSLLAGSVTGNVVWANLAGVPALSTPIGRSDATGMPFGVQIGMRAWQEAELLQLAVDYQAAHPYWADAPKPLATPRDIPTSKVITGPKGKPDPTNTDAKHPAFQIIPTLATEPA